MRRVAAIAVCVTGFIVPGSAQVPQRPPLPMIIDYMPQVADLDKAERFYHELLGIESPQGDPRARLEWYPTRPFLVDMYAIPGKIRNFYLRVPVSDMMIEPIQWSDAKGKPLNPRMQDPGATRLILNVNNIDVLTERLRRGGAKVISSGGKPLTMADETGMKRVIVFEDFNGFFVELVQREPLPPRTGDAPPTFYIDRSDFALTVSDLDKSVKFYGEIFGLQVKTDASFRTDAKWLDALGMKGAQYREATVAWPDKTPQVRLVEFKGIDRKPLTPLVPDPCSTILRINVRDVDSILAKVKTFPDAKIMNVSGRPALQGRNAFVIVRAPGGTYLQFVGPAPNQSQ